MKKVHVYRQRLRTLAEWDSFLLQESGLPGRRANLELARAVADEGGEELFERFLASSSSFFGRLFEFRSEPFAYREKLAYTSKRLGQSSSAFYALRFA